MDNTFIIARKGVHEELFMTLKEFTQAYREGWRSTNEQYNEAAANIIKKEDEARNQLNLF